MDCGYIDLYQIHWHSRAAVPRLYPHPHPHPYPHGAETLALAPALAIYIQDGKLP